MNASSNINYWFKHDNFFPTYLKKQLYIREKLGKNRTNSSRVVSKIRHNAQAQ
jgi:hypothetical protein